MRTRNGKEYVNLNEDDIFISFFCYSNVSVYGRLVGRE